MSYVPLGTKGTRRELSMIKEQGRVAVLCEF